MPDESGQRPVADAAPVTRPRAVDPQAPPGSRRGQPQVSQSVEIGGPPGPEPTRFGDWERAGRCIDF
ncbi:MAG TPA: DUF1674 domain-containing protein [Gammaproteobacteria bacterium]|nr:DUF1674 domain-containing protein [Gammaproteobacteria bacterium]